MNIWVNTGEKKSLEGHAVCIPSPFQSHIKAMLKLSKLLHHYGFQITFVNTEFNHTRFLNSNPSLHTLSGFHFKTIPDQASSQDLVSLADSISNSFLAPFLHLLSTLPSATCVVADGFMSFAIQAAKHYHLPVVQLFTIAASGLMGYKHLHLLLDKAIAPVEDKSSLTNEFLDTAVDWVPGMGGIRLRDLPCCWRTNDAMFNFVMDSAEKSVQASAVVVHSFDALERDVLDALSMSTSIPLYAIGPLELLVNRLPESPLKALPYSLWKEETECLEWLDLQSPESVIYVNFGSIAVLTQQQVVEFGWGLANSKQPFLWVIRPDLVSGESGDWLKSEFKNETKERSLITSWCPQEEVLNHPSLAGFLTHSGWNSTIESVSCGVPMLCYPSSGEQPTNCWLACKKWEVGLEIGSDVKREHVEGAVRELIEGEKGKEMKRKAKEWKRLALEATDPQGSSFTNLSNLVNHLLSLQN